ncbi:MAG: hypothetical protein ACE5OW_04490 [Candidatus Bathyarchaeia archaeon]
MVARKSLICVALVFTMVLLTIPFVLNASNVGASEIQYHLDHEWAKIWINEDGTIDLLYDIKISCDEGKIRYVNVGQPTGDFTIGRAVDENGNILQTEDVSDDSYFAVRVYLSTPITTGESVRFNVITNVGHMIWEDEQNPGNVGMQFIPVWWGAEVHELRVLVVLPQGITKENVRCTPNWDNAYVEDNRLVLYWERRDLPPNEKFLCGVSFPKEYIQHYEKPKRGLDWFLTVFLPQNWPVIAFFTVFIGIFGLVIYRGRKRTYMKPLVRMETLGIRRGLTAVEASYILEFPPTKVVTEILYSLLMKRAVWVTATTPALKLKVMEPFRDRTGTPETPLRYYEKSFLEAIKADGSLSEEKLAKTVMLLRDTVEGKLRGYCRRDTVEYYRKIVAEAWGQVEQAGTPELASKAYDENLLWLLLDENFQSRTQTAFRDKTFEPQPDWWWYGYGYGYYHPHPTYKPSPTTRPTKPISIPGAEFADNIATAVEKTTNNIVTNVEKFARSIIPTPPPSEKTSRAPASHGASCACACASCACACACVSCACACASGGVG